MKKMSKGWKIFWGVMGAILLVVLLVAGYFAFVWQPPAASAVSEQPVIEEPAVEEPVVEEPAVEEPVVEEPAVEEPAVEEPAVEEPVVEEPAAEEPIVVYGFSDVDDSAEKVCASTDNEAADAVYQVTQSQLPYFSGFETGNGSRRPVRDEIGAIYTLVIEFPEGLDRAVLDRLICDDECLHVVSCPPSDADQHARNLLPAMYMTWVTTDTLQSNAFSENWLLVAETRRVNVDPNVGEELKQNMYSSILGEFGRVLPGHRIIVISTDTLAENVGADVAIVSDITGYAFDQNGHAYTGAWTYTPMAKDWGREVDMPAYMAEMEEAQARIYAAIQAVK